MILFFGCSNQYEKQEPYTLVSTTNGTSYTIEVLTPIDYDSSKSYPTVYLLDSSVYLDSLYSIVSKLKSEDTTEDIIVVGINYTDKNPQLERMNDMTYPASSTDLGVPTGGGEKFHTFIKDELVPDIEGKYSADSSKRTFMGHSIGGFMVLYSLFQHYRSGTTPFTNFVAVSPSIWWEDSYIIGQEKQTRHSSSTLNAKLYMGGGTLETVVMNAPLQTLDTNIKASNYIGLTYKNEVFDGRGHMSTPHVAFESALKAQFGK